MHNLKSGELNPADASMKALPKRKGNDLFPPEVWALGGASMKALPKRKGNSRAVAPEISSWVASMKALPKRKGNVALFIFTARKNDASMKALPKRKGNTPSRPAPQASSTSLNESPSQKEGKFGRRSVGHTGYRQPQ